MWQRISKFRIISSALSLEGQAKILNCLLTFNSKLHVRSKALQHVDLLNPNLSATDLKK